MADKIVDNLTVGSIADRMEPDEPRNRSPSGAEVAEWVRDRIRRGRFVPGQRLVEIDIIRQTRASRSKVREALQRLEAAGLVAIEEFRGATVRGASMEEVRQIYRTRAAIEGITVADFTERAPETLKKRLIEIQDALELCVEAREPTRFGQLNAEWHRTIIEGSGNLVAAELLERLNVPIHRLLFESFYSEGRLRAANADHRAILAAILAGDADAAERAMRGHIEDGFSTLADIDSELHN